MNAVEQARVNAERSWILLIVFVAFVVPAGLLYLGGRWIYRHVEVRMRAEKSACESGDAAACAKVGEAYAETNGRYDDDAVAEKYFLHGCKLGDAKSCDRLGWIATHTSDDNFSYALAMPAFARACRGGVADACNEAGEAYFHGVSFSDLDVPEDHPKAAAFFERGCAGGVMEACAHLSWLLRFGQGVAHDPERARELSAKACAGGYAKACK